MVSLHYGARRGLVASVLALCCALGAGAQERRLALSDSAVPMALFTAFVNQPSMYLFGAGGPETVVQIGRMPPALEARVPRPPGSRVLGTISSTSADFISLETDGNVDSVRAFIARELPQRGWRASNQSSSGGFRTAGSVRVLWCGGSSLLTYDVVRHDAGRTQVSYSLRQEDMGACSSRGARPLEALPTLYNPEESHDSPASCGNIFRSRGALDMSMSSTIESQMTPQQLIDFYGKQLADSGWVLPSPNGEGTTVTRTWQKRQSDGAVKTTTVTVTVPTGKPACRILELRSGR